MAIFGSRDDRGPSTGSPESRQGAGEGSISIIAQGMTITGDVSTEGVVKIEGTVEGNVFAGRQVLIGRQGMVRGDIHTREAIVGGTVVGSITADERLELQGTASIHGDLHTRAIAVVEGATLNGAVHIGDAAEPAAERSPAPDAAPDAALALAR